MHKGSLPVKHCLVLTKPLWHAYISGSKLNHSVMKWGYHSLQDGRMSEASILVVEDEPSIREVVTLYLERAGYKVRSVEDGADAKRILKKDPPDLVLLDLMLPGIDGYEITNWL